MSFNARCLKCRRPVSRGYSWCERCNDTPDTPELDDFITALRRASQAHPGLRLGQLILNAWPIDWMSRCDFIWDVSNTDITDALNRFAESKKESK